MSRKEDILGKCSYMCPVTECTKREKNSLIHVLETDPLLGNSRNSKTKAVPNRMIKSYSRSAAGHVLLNPELLRPVPVLLQTIEHLFSVVINDNRVSPLVRYDFINDRLRSVKQDGVIQRLLFEDWFRILPPIIRFYAFSSYWYCDERPERFDQKLNTDRLVDCLTLYISNHKSLDVEEFSQINSELEAVFLIVNSNRTEVVNRAVLLNLPNSVFQNTLKIILNWRERRYVSVIRILTKLQLLPACLFVGLHFNKVRKEILQIMSYAYDGRNLQYPLDVLQKNLLLDTLQETINECTFYKIPLSLENNTIQFKKGLLRNEVACPRKMKKLDELQDGESISHLVLG